MELSGIINLNGDCHSHWTMIDDKLSLNKSTDG
jgi:hypothetical protein